MISAQDFQHKLLAWYKSQARVLPWRSDPTPYKVWISEMMLQQTRVDTVIPYFDRFIAQVPSVQALAEIEEDQLLKLWQGLGYYNRALNLKKAAQKIVLDFGGQVPSELLDLQTLPGIGAYSGGAIASIAFDKRVPAVDGNVLRVIARITADPADITEPNTKKQMEELVTALLPTEGVGDFNQALMELGALICLPNGEPKCSQCPVNTLCEALKNGLVSQLPVKADRKKRKIELKTVFVISCKNRFVLRKRADKGLLPNLWEFPHTEGHLTQAESRSMLEGWGITVESMLPIKLAKHIFTHMEWHMTGYLVTTENAQGSPDWVWATQEEMQQCYSIPTAFSAFSRIASEMENTDK